MNNRKISVIFSCILLVFGVFLTSCSTKMGSDKNLDNNEISKKNNETEQNQNTELGKYNVQGRIVKIDENGLHVQVDDKVKRYNVSKEKMQKYYIGENVGLSLLENNDYDVAIDETYDYSKRYTPEGELINRVTGTIGDITDDSITTVTEMGNLKFPKSKEFDLKRGSQVMFDYVKMHDGNQVVSYYDESSKIKLKIKEISKDETGMMKLLAVSDDNKDYYVNLDSDTVVNFSHSSLSKNEEIVVYPDNISTDTPPIIKAKMLVRSNDK